MLIYRFLSSRDANDLFGRKITPRIMGFFFFLACRPLTGFGSNVGNLFLPA